MISGTDPESILPAVRTGKVRATFLLLLFALGGTMNQCRSQPVNATTHPENLSVVLNRFGDQIHEVRLKNGLRLIMMKRSYAPITSLYIKFRAGGVDETPETAGIAHMLEHMLFKGTPHIGTRDYEKEKKYLEVVNRWALRLDGWRRKLDEAEASGDMAAKATAEKNVKKWSHRLDLLTQSARQFMIMDEDSYIYSINGQRGYNAYTSRDLTNYQIDLPSNRIEVWARLESDRIKNSVLRDFYTERNVVAEERRMRVDNVAQNLLMEQFLMKAYGDHPYGKPLIGSMKNIEYLNYEQAYHFYKTYYAPNNMVIAIVGDIDFDHVESLIRKYFGDMEPQTIPPTNPAPPVQQTDVHVDLKKEGSPVQMMGWFKPTMPDPDDLYLDILSRILAGRRDSRLIRNLVMRDRIASQIDIYSGFPGERFTNLFLIMAVPAPGKDYDQVQSAVMKEIQDIQKNGISGDELDRVRRNMQANFIYSLRSNASLADRLSYYETVTGDYKTLFRTYERLDAVTTEDIRRVAEKYLTEKDMMTARLLPPDKQK